jgi:NAD(P)-dependent dehydrogenase (short-subunit alcohol dehydrogenase family)
MFRLDGKVALVTGATGGIGLASAHFLASAGADVVLTGLQDEDPVGVARRLAGEGLSVTGLPCNVLDDDDLAGAVATCIEAFGGLDVTVCNAGAALDTGPHLTSTDAQLDRMVDLHIRSPLHLANLAMPQMARGGGGSFVIVSSLAGLRGNRLLGLYGVTKAGNAQLARNLAVQWGSQRVRANAVSPGVIDTPFAEPITSDPGLRERRLDRTPLGRFGTAMEVAATIGWLASGAGAFVTGQNIVIDGGTLIYD